MTKMKTTKSLHMKDFNEDNRTFTGYLSKYDNIDRDNDVFVKGAFSKALEKRTTYPLLLNHDMDKIIGYIDAEDTEKGVYVTGHLFDKEVEPLSEKIYQMLQVGALMEMSVGFGVEKPFKDKVARRKGGQGGFVYKETYLREGSVVMVPANPEAIIDSVKNAVESGEIEEVDFEVEKEPKKSEGQAKAQVTDKVEVVDNDVRDVKSVEPDEPKETNEFGIELQEIEKRKEVLKAHKGEK